MELDFWNELFLRTLLSPGRYYWWFWSPVSALNKKSNININSSTNNYLLLYLIIISHAEIVPIFIFDASSNHHQSITLFIKIGWLKKIEEYRRKRNTRSTKSDNYSKHLMVQHPHFLNLNLHP